MRTALVLFNRDLRVTDHPALTSATAQADRVVPLFVFDRALLSGRLAAPNRLMFLLEALADLDRSLRARGAGLVVRHGDPVREAITLARETGAQSVHASGDVSGYAQARQRRLADACERERIDLHVVAGITVVSPGDLLPTGGGNHFKVFTPYWRRWRLEPLREPSHAPKQLRLPRGLAKGRLPKIGNLTRLRPSLHLMPGGETAARKRLAGWLRSGLAAYGEFHDDLASSTSGLSPYLRFGCISATEVVRRAGDRPGAEDFIRQLCWRDFFAQVTAARPDVSRRDYRPRGDRWNRGKRALEAWKDGVTGYPIVDAGMRQLAREGHMHNRARLIAGSFLTKDLYLDWRLGAQHFWDLLLDGDIPNNALNWQWVAGTGNDSRPNRVLNPVAQAKRYDAAGDYVRRYVPELGAIAGARVHEPWRLPASERRPLRYPEPIVDHAHAAALFRGRRA